MGVMEEIRQLLADGESSGDLIKLGYAPGTIYKVQRQLRRRRQQQDGQEPASLALAEGPLRAMADQLQARIEELEAENAGLRQQLDKWEDRVVELNSLNTQLEAAQARVRALDMEVATGRDREKQVKVLESNRDTMGRALHRLALLSRRILDDPPCGFSRMAAESEIESLATDPQSLDLEEQVREWLNGGNAGGSHH